MTHVYHKWTIIWCKFPDVECDLHNFLSFWTMFCPLTSLTTRKSKFWKNEKNPWRDHNFAKSFPRIMIMLYCSWDVAHDGCIMYFTFWAVFYPFTPLTTQKVKIKNIKKTRRYHHFTYVYQKLWSHGVWIQRYGGQWMDKWMDTWMEKVT